MPTSLNDNLTSVSSGPGVYLMKDALGKIIYIGKARHLKKRLSSYFIKPVHKNMKTEVLIKKISTFETILTGAEKEALILEANLIKKHKPRYNVILKDDKEYPCLRIDIKSSYPCLSIVRKMKKDGALYFGPFASSSAVRQTLGIINKTFKLRKCKTKNFKSRSRPCINYQMGRCFAPCCFDVDMAEYNEIIKEVTLFLNGKTCNLIHKTRNDMLSAAGKKDFETAALLRDKMFALEKTLERQSVVTTDFIDRDVLAIARTPAISVITLLAVRSGVLVGTHHFTFKETMSSDAEMTGSFIRQYYEKIPFIPQEILVPVFLDDASLTEELLGNIKGKKVNILHPKRGEKVRLVEIAAKNAENRIEKMIASDAVSMDILARLKKHLRMDKLPILIECFDNSNISGKDPVSAMVVFENGRPNKSLYRKYKINNVPVQNDYAYMAEVLRRRYGNSAKSRSYPDILLVDGGKGQIGIALSVIKDLNIEGEFKVIGIAKKDKKKGETEDKVYIAGRSNQVNFGREGDVLHLLQRIRDEAHRFAITFHRKRRGKRFISSVLDRIDGVGEKRKKILLGHFKSIKKIRAAPLEELCALPGMNRKVAEAVKKRLSKNL